MTGTDDDDPKMFSVEECEKAIVELGDPTSPRSRAEIAHMLRIAADAIEKDGLFDYAARRVADAGARIREAIEAKDWDCIRGFDMPTHDYGVVLPKRQP